MKILIALSTYNRPYVTQLCLENLQQVRSENVKLAIYDDASTEYDYQYLSNYADDVTRFDTNMGISYSRATAIRDFVFKYLGINVVYFTDNDTMHDPQFIEIIKTLIKYQEDNQQQMPFSLYNTVFHTDIVSQTDTYNIQNTIAGVSQGYTRPLAERLVSALNTVDGLDKQFGWDYLYPQLLSTSCMVTKTSYVEHFARDRFESGMHSTNSGTAGADALADFERDRAVNPSEYLVSIRDATINKILGT